MADLKIAIDGASGFVGANLVRYFENKYRVFALSRNKDGWRLAGSSAEFVEFDVTNRQMVREKLSEIKPDVFVHCAVFGGYHFETDPQKIIDTNVTGTLNTLDACRDVSLFINTGSSSEYGIRSTPMKETDELAPNTSYAMTKALIASLLASRRGVAPKSVTLRLFSAYGYYEEKHRLVPYVLYSLLTGQKAVLSNRTNVRDFIFVDDIGKAYELAIQKHEALQSGDVFNVGSGKQSTIEDVVKVTGTDVDWQPSARQEEAKRMWQADISKIGKVLGWKPEHSLKDGLDKTKEWMRDNLRFYEDVKNDKLTRFKQNSA